MFSPRDAAHSIHKPPQHNASSTADEAPFALVPWKPRIDDPRVISKQMGAEVRMDDGEILKRGRRVRQNEEAALHLVKKYTTIPVPKVYDSEYKTVDSLPWGQIWMEHMPGSPLDKIWDTLEDSAKENICNELWGFVEQLRRIPKPPSLGHLYQCGADGSACRDRLLEDLRSPPEPLLSDDLLRKRINERYLYFNGGSYGENLMDYLPHSDQSVFTHADLAPRNVLVDDRGKITGLIDWEFAGWYPDYWEYAKTQVQWLAEDFMVWMNQTKPQDWNIIGIHKAKRVLF
ncbi:kinase-like protein [Xylaria sp. FL1042]|nr:kinase-like protein [Xylaria sp. FL1042]